jgi:hypothetical protein
MAAIVSLALPSSLLATAATAAGATVTAGPPSSPPTTTFLLESVGTSAAPRTPYCVTFLGTANGQPATSNNCASTPRMLFQVVPIAGSTTLFAVHVPQHPGMCLDTANGSAAAGVALVQGACAKSTSQQWDIVAAGGGTSALINVKGGLCMDGSGTPVVQRACSYDTYQQWKLVPLPTDAPFVLATPGAPACGSLPTPVNGAPLLAGPCVSPVGTRFKLTTTGDGAPHYTVAVSSSPGMCLDTENGWLSPGVPVVQGRCTLSGTQSWTVTPTVTGQLTMVNDASGLCMDARGSLVVQEPCTGTASQAWELISPPVITSVAPPVDCVRNPTHWVYTPTVAQLISPESVVGYLNVPGYEPLVLTKYTNPSFDGTTVTYDPRGYPWTFGPMSLNLIATNPFGSTTQSSTLYGCRL